MIKGAIIGAGKIAETGHFPAYLSDRLKDKMEICAIIDTSEERLIAANKYFPNASLYTDLDVAILNENINFIDICTPPHLHKEIIKTCVNNKIHVISEKPVASKLSDALEIEAIIKNAGVVFVPCHQFKYAPVWEAFTEYARAIKDSKMFIQFDVVRLQADGGFDPNNPNWRTDGDIGGGGISVDTGIHYFYLLLNMLGVPDSVTAELTVLKHELYGVEDSAFVRVNSPKGTALVNLTWAGNNRFNSAMLVSSEISLYYDGEVIKICEKDHIDVVRVPNMSDKSVYISLYTDLFEEFYKRVEANNYSCDLFDEAVNAMKILECAKVSSAKKSTAVFS